MCTVWVEIRGLGRTMMGMFESIRIAANGSRAGRTGGNFGAPRAGEAIPATEAEASACS